MSPGPLPPRPPRRPGLGTPASKRRLGFPPATTLTPSSMHLAAASGVGAEHIIEVIGRIRSRVRGETGARVRRVDDSPYTTTTSKSKRGRAHAAEERGTVEVIRPITNLVRGETGGGDAFRRGMCSKRRLDNSPCTTTTTPRTKRRRADDAGGAAERPVEVIGRIRNRAADTGASALEIACGGTTVRVRGAAGLGGSCRDFVLDGVSVAEEEGQEGFYRRFVQSRIQGVRAGAKCTVIVYGPTASGKSHTMFGCADQPGIVYRALWDILGGGDGADSVKVSVLEIYNEEVYDLLPNPKPKVRLEAMGTNATYIFGNKAGKISREVAKVEKRRDVKSTNCNARSSRSHCMIILDVPSVGGRLMLVDMAGSENIEAAGRTGHEAKSETRSINRGNTTLKRVVESIANGGSHVPFRDSKLTMLLRDSFVDDRSKILMILCASPDPKELHKTISTLQYGARAKGITSVACASTPRDKMSSNEAQIQLKHVELARLRAQLSLMEAREEEIIAKVAEETRILRGELRTTEEKMLMQQQELLAVKQQLQEVAREKLEMEEESHLAWREGDFTELRIFLRNLGWRGTAHEQSVV